MAPFGAMVWLGSGRGVSSLSGFSLLIFIADQCSLVSVSVSVLVFVIVFGFVLLCSGVCYFEDIWAYYILVCSLGFVLQRRVLFRRYMGVIIL